MAEVLLDTGKVDIESSDPKYGQTPLPLAAKSGHDSVIKILLDTGNVETGQPSHPSQP